MVSVSILLQSKPCRNCACGTAARFSHARQEKNVYNTHKVAMLRAEPERTKVCLTIKALPATEPRESVIDVQRQH